VILFLTGAQLALGSCEISKDKGERFDERDPNIQTASAAVITVAPGSR
jgi:hypothetical protein